MRRILTTTAIAALTAMPLYAEQHTGNSNEAQMQVTVGDQEFRASNMMGATVYMPAEGESQNVEGMEVSEVPDSWTEIGSVEDVFVGNNGDIATVVFAPNGETASDKDRVGLETASVEFKKAADGNEIYVVYTGDKVTLEESEEFDQASAEASGQTSAADMQQEQQQANADNDQMNADQQNEQQANAGNEDMQSEDQRMQQAASAETEKDGLTIRAMDLSGHAVYIPAEGTDTANMSGEMSEVSNDWERVGDVGNVVLSREGEIKSVTLDAGGFLGMGEKEIETSMDDLRFVRDSDADADNEYFIVFTGDRSKLEDEEEFNRTQAEAEGDQVMTPDYAEQARAAEQTGNDMPEGEQTSQNTTSASGSQEQDMAENDNAMSEDAQNEETAQNDMSEDAQNEETAQNDMSEDRSEDEQMADAGSQNAGNGESMTDDQMAQLTASELEGQTVYGTNGESIGDVSTLVLADSGEIDQVIVDVGGFLGIGEKPVALPFDELDIQQNGEGMNAIEVSTDHTQEDLESMETWDDV
ncbi:PRC-barrel domain-containing protein [Maritimibacter sp. UBA3975]|uniref:PRC-barrel domain-containing protein n=1 Tax=Maritimibacter sp. UBA3975 TaxID=1946833 RepID=UPI0025C684A9|nr:PRC-barrel domain-containing protein [Maritimibacter sp. UBA3975]|tara:strand:+ start:6331 stop:7914 length:1584 start_codon:yes stop_codon:yes gene_type:complete